MNEKTICYYCEVNQAVKMKYKQACCEKCDTDFWSSNRMELNIPERDMARRHKILLKTFEDAFGKRK